MAHLTKAQKVELDALASRSEDGKLHVREIVAYARNPETSLHKAFEWDDSKAAEAYRLDQARTLVEVYVETVDGVPTRTYVSLVPDRAHGGGYMRREDAVDSEITRALLVAQFKDDLRSVLRRYSYLREIAADVFETIEPIVVPRRDMDSAPLGEERQARRV